MPDLSLRRITIVVIGLAVVAALLWSATFSTQDRMVEVPAAGGTYIEGLVGQPHFLNPILSDQNSVDQDISSLLFNGLTKVSDNGVVEQDLAERWDISDSGKVYTFDIRQDAKWHDGWPVLADDVVFTIKAIQSPDYLGNPAIADLWKNVTVEKVSDRRVKFTLKDAFAPFLEHVSQPLIPAHLLANVPLNKLGEDRFSISPVGTGPFKVTQASLKEVVLEANPDYYGDKPHLDKIRFHFYPDEKSAANALQKDEIEGLGALSPALAQGLKEDRKTTVFSAPEFSKLTLLLLNTKSGIFSDKSVRQAVAYSIDRQNLIDNVLSGQAVKTDSPVMPISWAYNREAKKYDYDPGSAKTILEADGWRDEDGDGILEKNGQKLSFVLLTNDRPERVKAAQEISVQLQQIGMKADVQTVGWDGFVQDFLVPRNFQAALAEQWSPSADPDTYQFWHSSQTIGGGLYFATWTNRTADELLENARRSIDNDGRAKLYRDFQALFAEEEPSVLLYYPVFNYAQRNAIRGVRLGLMTDPDHRFNHISEWYLRTQRVVLDKKSEQ